MSKELDIALHQNSIRWLILLQRCFTVEQRYNAFDDTKQTIFLDWCEELGYGLLRPIDAISSTVGRTCSSRKIDGYLERPRQPAGRAVTSFVSVISGGMGRWSSRTQVGIQCNQNFIRHARYFVRRRVSWKNAARWIGNGCAMEFGGQLKKEGFENRRALVVVVEFKDGFKNY
jgi:hypothetical protein